MTDQQDTPPEVELLPCPFCGSDAYIQEDAGRFYAACTNLDCGCCYGEAWASDAMPVHQFIEETGAIAAWNTRIAAERTARLDGVEQVSHRLLARMREVARQDGWALGLHGSMRRDLDLIAVPWTDSATDETAFVEAMRAAVARELAGHAFIGAGDDKRNPCAETKPHGRRCWIIHGISDQLVEDEQGAHPYIDLAVMDFRTARLDAAAGLVSAAKMALMYLETGFLVCSRCGNEEETKNLDAVYELSAALSPQPASDDAADLVAFGASDAACYLFPGEHQAAERDAYCRGAAHAHMPSCHHARVRA